MVLVLALLIALLDQAARPPIRVHGTLPAGAHLDFQPVGSPHHFPVTAGEGDGKYSLSVPPDHYDVVLVYGSGRRARGSAWLTHSQVELNAAGENPRPSSSVEYDLLADWRVTDESGQGVGPATVTLEAEPGEGAAQKLTVWTMTGDEEKEVAGDLETTPDGRFVFRVRESRLRPEQVVALRVTVSRKGYEPSSTSLIPILEFSESGHFSARYPDEGVEIKLRKTR